MSMCYLCDLCANWWTERRHRFGIDLLPCQRGGRQFKLPFDYGRDDPHEICEHFKRKEGVDE